MTMRMVSFSVFCCLLLAGSAKSDELPPTKRGILTTLTLEGSTSFDSDAIRSALRVDPDVLWELERDAPPKELAGVLREKVVTGYRHAGFPDADVEPRTNGDAGAIIIGVHEGPRYRAGAVRVDHAVRIPVEDVLTALTTPFPPHHATPRFYEDGDDQVVEWVDADGEEVECEEAIWTAGEWASFADEPRQRLERHVRSVLADFGFPTAEFHIQQERDDVTGTVDLVIVIDDEGRQAKVERIELIGNERNSREAILACLQVQPSVVFTREERVRIERRLWHSGRFAKYQVQLIQPQRNEDPFILQIRVAECADVSPIDQPPTPEEQALLKAREWLSRFKRDGYELVARTKLGELVFAPRQGIVLIHTDRATDGTAPLQQAAMITAGRLGFYDLENERKLEFPLPMLRPTLNFELDVAAEPDRLVRCVIGGSIKWISASDQQTLPKLNTRLSPALFMLTAHRLAWAWEDDQLVTRGDLGVLKIDPRTGQVSAESDPSAPVPWRVAFERGAFATRKAEIAQSIGDANNEYDPRRVASSARRFREILNPDGVGRSDNKTGDGLVATLDLVSQLVADGLLAREGAATDDPRKSGSNRFSIPGQRKNTDGFVNAMALSAYAHSDNLFPPGYWPWELWRSVSAYYMGDERFARSGKAAFVKLLRSSDNGPVVDLFLSRLTKKSPAMSRYIARRGLSRLKAADFQKDYGPLIDNRYLCGDLVQRAVDILREKDPRELDELFEDIPAPFGPAARDVVDYLQQRPDRATEDLLPRALDRVWEAHFRKRVEETLRTRTLPLS